MKPLVWFGGRNGPVLGFIKALPERNKKAFGHMLRDIQNGGHPAGSKQLKGFVAGVLELTSGGYRAVVVTFLPDRVSVVHAFKKDAQKGSRTRAHHIDTIRERVRMLPQGGARGHHQ